MKNTGVNRFTLRSHLTSLLLLLLVLGTAEVFSQKSPAETYSLKWNSPVTMENGQQRLHFEQAQYLPESDLLPVFIRKFDNKLRSVKLLNAVFQPLETSEQLLAQGISNAEPTLVLHEGVEQKKSVAVVHLLPFRMNTKTGKVEKLVSFQFSIESATDPTPVRTFTTSQNFAANSVLESGNWYKIGVVRDGAYKLGYDFFQNAGIPGSEIDVQRFRLFGNGGGMLPQKNSTSRNDDLQECAIDAVDQNNNGKFDEGDYFLFYGQGPDRWTYSSSEAQYIHQKNNFSDTTYYFFQTQSTQPGLRINNLTNLPPTGSEVTVASFTDYQFHEEELRNFIKSGREWFGEVFDVSLSQRISFRFPNLLPFPVKIKSSVAARTATSFSSNSQFKVLYNGSQVLNHVVANVGTSYTDDFARTSVLNGSFNGSGSDINIDYNFVPYNASATGYLDYVALNATRALSLSGDQLLFRDRDSTNSSTQRNYIIGNARSGLELWSVSNHNAVARQPYTLTSNQAQFIQNLSAGAIQEYLLFDPVAAFTPQFFGKIANQNLHGLGQANYLIITHPDFLREAERLAEFHRDKDNLSSHVVTTTQIYNEFSSGAQDVSAVRDFIRMFYERATTPAELPRYALLFGDGSYDPKNRLGGNTNFIPCYQSENSVSLLVSYTSDDFFGLLDSNEGLLTGPELMDVGIGRIPVRDLSEAREMVDKVITYSTVGVINDQTYCAGSNSTRLGDWRNTLCFIADDQDRNLHLRQSERILGIVQQNHPVYNIDKINSDAYQQVSTPGGQRYPDVNEAINKRIEKGALLINYTGHGGELGWASESILNNDMINSWRNTNNMPCFITATCEFSRYDDPQRTSAGELVLLNGEGGGICLFTTVRLAFAIDNELINSDMMTHFFNPINGEMPRAGDIQRLAKADNPSNRNVTLLGDPALRLAYPKYKVVATSIEESDSGLPVDTISALSKITIKGIVTDQSGLPLSNFNGIVFPSVYDKQSKVYTLVNDASGSDISVPDSFLIRKNILYKGKSSVVNGNFSCSFITPRDIAFQYGTGRISFYAHNGTDDAQGHSDGIVIGGTSANLLNDQNGPEIKLYLNDENFVAGSITNSTPSIYALMFDSSGINTVGNGIGHDITARIDQGSDKLFVLNDFYESDLNSYQQGRVRYQLDDLSEGPHTLTLKAWDINNNSSESTTEFIVASSAELALERVLNYPNPFTTRTQFMFEHNKPCTGMAIQVQIYTVSGKLVKTIDAYQVCEGFRNIPVEWDGKDDFGDPLAKGVYVYRLRIRTAEGESAQKMERLVLLR